jgi:hypothetical protein
LIPTPLHFSPPLLPSLSPNAIFLLALPLSILFARTHSPILLFHENNELLAGLLVLPFSSST